MKTYGGVEGKLHTLLNFALKMNGDYHRNDLPALSPEKEASARGGGGGGGGPTPGDKKTPGPGGGNPNLGV